ncbi:hypothetical protein Zmor_004600 [Zophobas morio]|uniref:PHD-type domain-containing protein n=1 Tax=Zophobas morio TaxID=2755281 RepID=A0AA38IQK1_9CUCU|nr:hypothetical protein Zmor_004600 [Zophobas morio]
MICPNCDNSVKTNETSFQCDACQKHLHAKCIGLSENDVKMTRSKSKSIKLICNSCEKNLNALSDLKSLISNIRAEFTSSLDDLKTTFQQQINDLKSMINNHHQPNPAQPNFEDVVQEVVERQKRSKNVMIYNVPEQPETMSRDERLMSETTDISNILQVASNDVNIANIRLQRLDKFIPGRCRPIKVFLQSEVEVLNIVRGAKNLSTRDIYKNVRLSFDKTPKQLGNLKLLKSQMLERINNGETGLKIRHFNGVPRIIRHLN